MAGPEIGTVEVAFGFRECEFIGNVTKAHDFGARHVEGADVVAGGVDHGEPFADVFDGFALAFVFAEQTRRCTLVAVQHEVDKVLP